MKKQNKIIIGLILGVAVIILLISFLFPAVYKGLTSGTFGKADKYRQEQMTENDIQLRSDFTRDTAQLRQMITGLIYFALFTDNLSMTIDTCLESYRLQGFDKDPANSQVIALLKDYNSFLKNNTRTLASTTRMLAAFLLRDTTAQSTDIEQNLRDFANYVNQVNQKDSVLMLALNKVDSYLTGNKTLQKKTDEIRNLKAIRDQLVIKSTQFMAMTGNKQGLGMVSSYAVRSQAQFNNIGALNMTTARGREEVQAINAHTVGAQNIIAAGNSNLNMAFNANALQAGMAGAKINSAATMNYMVYDKANLQIVYCTGTQLQLFCGAGNLQSVMAGSNPNLGIVEIAAKDNIGVVLNASVLCSLLNSASLLGFNSTSQLNIIIPARDLAAVGSMQSVTGINAAIPLGFAGNAGLQGLANANAGLQGLFNSMNAMNNGFPVLRNIALGTLPTPAP